MDDELGQALVVMKQQLASGTRMISEDSEGARNRCFGVMAFVDSVVEDVRRVSVGLSPSVLEHLGLTASLEWLTRTYKASHDIEMACDMPDIDGLFARETHVVVYRILEETLANIGKHAGAKHVEIIVRRGNGAVVFRVKDDGKGFDAAEPDEKAARRWGLALMEERARMLGGRLQVTSEIGKGTQVLLTIPVEGGRGQGGFTRQAVSRRAP